MPKLQKSVHFLLLMSVPAVLACGTGSEETDTGSGSPDSGVVIDTGVATDTGVEPDAGFVITIPDPGDDDGDWGFSTVFECCSVPGEAYPVGIIDQNTGYAQGNISMETHDFFYVFKTGPSFTEFIWDGFGIDLEYTHVHEGAGLVFGPEVPPREPNGLTWDLQPDTIYVLELHSFSGGFF